MAVGVDVVDAGGAFYDGNSVSSVTGSVTVGAGANALLVFTGNVTGITCTGVTCNGVSLTSLGSVNSDFYGNEQHVELWELTDPPTGTAYDLAATWSGAQQDLGFTWQSFSGVDSYGIFSSNTSPVNGTSANPTLAITGWVSGDYALGSLLGSATITADDTEMGNYVSVNNNDIHVSTEYETTDGGLSWTSADGIWAACGVALKPAAGGITPPLAYIQSQ